MTLVKNRRVHFQKRIFYCIEQRVTRSGTSLTFGYQNIVSRADFFPPSILPMFKYSHNRMILALPNIDANFFRIVKPVNSSTIKIHIFPSSFRKEVLPNLRYLPIQPTLHLWIVEQSIEGHL